MTESKAPRSDYAETPRTTLSVCNIVARGDIYGNNYQNLLWHTFGVSSGECKVLNMDVKQLRISASDQPVIYVTGRSIYKATQWGASCIKGYFDIRVH